MSRILDAFLKNERGLRRSLTKFSLRDHDIDDVVQETFIKGFAAELKSDIREPKRFLYRVARNIAISHLRKNKTSPTDALEDFGGADVVLDEAQQSAESLVDSRQKIIVLTEAVAHLPPQCRKAFLMRRVEGLAFKQIAVRMDISVSAVEKYVKTGLLKCNAFLRERGYQPSEFGGAHIRLPGDALDNQVSKKAPNRDE